MTSTKVVLALLSLLAVIIASPGALAAPKSTAAKKTTGNTDNQISMVMEPQGNQLKIFLTSKTDLNLQNAVVEASYHVGGQPKSLIVKRQNDTKNRKPFYLIEKFDPAMTNLKINVKVGQYAQTFNLPDMK